MSEQNHMANKIDGPKVEKEAKYGIDPSPTTASKFVFIIIVALLLVGTFVYFFMR
jgi:hypothetical protein